MRTYYSRPKYISYFFQDTHKKYQGGSIYTNGENEDGSNDENDANAEGLNGIPCYILPIWHNLIIYSVVY